MKISFQWIMYDGMMLAAITEAVYWVDDVAWPDSEVPDWRAYHDDWLMQ